MVALKIRDNTAKERMATYIGGISHTSFISGEFCYLILQHFKVSAWASLFSFVPEESLCLLIQAQELGRLVFHYCAEE